MMNELNSASFDELQEKTRGEKKTKDK